MKYVKVLGVLFASQIIWAQKASAALCEAPPCGAAVPEMDGSSAVIAIGLVVGLAALIREKFFRS